MVAIDKDEYINKTSELLNNYELAQVNPIRKYQIEIKESFRNCSFFDDKDL